MSTASRSVAEHAAEISEKGYTILENAIEADLVDAIAESLARLEKELGAVPAGNPFEGANTVRIYNLLARERIFEKIPAHAAVLPIVESVLDPGCLVSSLSSIAIDPGESAQPIHADDQLIPFAKPHVAVVCNTMWAITDFTEENGATRIIPGTHHKDHSPMFGKHYDSIAAEMPRGSVLVWHGSLWHGGGANRSGKRRTGIAMNYCAGYMRQQENQQLGIPPELVRGFEPRLQELCGFGIYSGLIGHIDKKAPAQFLFGEKRVAGMVWES
ncbi:MAG TPA: phytanoyl-CoA dioxygenase family protein [Candidatus Binatia bacterium]|jgi:ectoine hydroxylase-related dioxygenase (phytanoyl-CoA dioxygenase family)